MKFSGIIWIVIAVVTGLRLAFAASLPLTGDEAYYWEWSRRLAGGYVDHPPAVAFAIAAFSWLGRSPFAVRLAFVLCGLGSALAVAASANMLSDDKRAGPLAALALTLAPIMSVAFAVASPDGPYALAWSLSMYAAIRALRDRTPALFALLGLALGLTLLSRLFGVALAAGIAAATSAKTYRGIWRQGLWISYVIALLVFSPFLLWNASHHWDSFAFALLQRHATNEDQITRPLLVFALAALAFSPGLWIAGVLAMLRPRNELLTWTALPLCAALFVLSLHERVEAYWFIGPYVSLCIGIGCALPRLLAWTFAPAAVLSALAFAAALAPFTMYSLAQRFGLHLSDAGPFEIFTYPLLARDVRALAASQNAAVMTDGYGLSSLLDFYGGVNPVVIGYSAQGAEAYRWVPNWVDPARAVFIDKVPIQSRSDFVRQFARACETVTNGPTLTYKYRRFYTTWCEGMSPHGLRTLRWAH